MARFNRTIVGKTLQDAIIDLNEVETKRILDEKLANGENPQKIANELRQGVSYLTKEFKERVIGIVELGMAGRILRECQESLKSWYEGIELSSIGKVIIGTIQNDREDISHDLIATLLFGAGFDIIDLGGNVSHNFLIEKAKEFSPDIAIISGLDEDSIEMMKETINYLYISKIKTKIVVGPRIGMSYIFTIDDDLCKIIPADAFVNNLEDVDDLVRGLKESGI